jgi:hypothetical protein
MEFPMNPRASFRFLGLGLSLAAFVGPASRTHAIPLPDNSTTATSSTAFQITNNGTGKAGQFVLTDSTNASPALTATTNGKGYGLFSLMTGTGKSGYFQISNAANSSYALGGISNGTGYSVYGLMTGTGRAGYFEVNNASNTNAALSGTSNGSGYGLAGFMYGTGRAGYFQISNSASPKPALEVTTNGTGSAIKAVAGGTGLAGEFQGKVSATGSVTVGGTLASSGDVLELWANGERLYRLEKPAPDPTYGVSPNVIGGFSGNTVAVGMVGATISGGGYSGFINQVNNPFGTVSGGASNASSGLASTVGGGAANTASGDYSTVAGGEQNTANNFSSTVGGGFNGTSSGLYSTLSGGTSNTASGTSSTVSGGAANQALGSGSTVSGGTSNLAQGDFSFAAGFRAKAIHPGSFVWGDNTNADILSTNVNEFTARATGGVRFLTGTAGGGPPYTGVMLAPNGNQWLVLSDRNMKNHFQTLDPKQVLDKFSKLPITEWSYKAQDPSIRHIGPMAQDFYQAFGLGEDRLRIGTLDADGVMMAAIQGLNAELKDKEKQIATLKTENNSRIEVLEKKNAETQRRNEEMEARLSRLEHLLHQNKSR